MNFLLCKYYKPKPTKIQVLGENFIKTLIIKQEENIEKLIKMRLNKEDSELVTNYYQLKMQSIDGKYYNTDVMTTNQVLHWIQSIPSKNAGIVKQWLAEFHFLRKHNIKYSK